MLLQGGHTFETRRSTGFPQCNIVTIKIFWHLSNQDKIIFFLRQFTLYVQIKIQFSVWPCNLRNVICTIYFPNHCVWKKVTKPSVSDCGCDLPGNTLSLKSANLEINPGITHYVLFSIFYIVCVSNIFLRPILSSPTIIKGLALWPACICYSLELWKTDDNKFLNCRIIIDIYSSTLLLR